MARALPMVSVVAVLLGLGFGAPDGKAQTNATTTTTSPTTMIATTTASGDVPLTPASAGTVLGIPPVIQLTPVWCWLAVGEMVFRYYDVPMVNDVAQCGIVGALALGTRNESCVTDCRRCNVPAEDAATIMHMLADYPRRVALLGRGEAPRLFVTHTSALDVPSLRRELEGGRPVLAGINPTLNPTGRPAAFAASAHVALVVGWRPTPEGVLLVVNDPFPFDDVVAAGVSHKRWANPYLNAGATMTAPGQYIIAADDFTARLGWVESFLVRGDGWHPALTTRCQAGSPGQSTTCAAPPGVAPGSPCRCGLAKGVVASLH